MQGDREPTIGRVQGRQLHRRHQELQGHTPVLPKKDSQYQETVSEMNRLSSITSHCNHLQTQEIKKTIPRKFLPFSRALGRSPPDPPGAKISSS